MTTEQKALCWDALWGRISEMDDKYARATMGTMVMTAVLVETGKFPTPDEALGAVALGRLMNAETAGRDGA